MIMLIRDHIATSLKLEKRKKVEKRLFYYNLRFIFILIIFGLVLVVLVLIALR